MLLLTFVLLHPLIFRLDYQGLSFSFLLMDNFLESPITYLQKEELAKNELCVKF